MQETKNIRREIVTFLILTLILSVPFYVLISISGIDKGDFTQLYALGLMWGPGVAALVTRFIYHKNIRGFGWGWGKTRYQLLAYFLPLGYNLVLYGFIWTSGLGKIPDELTLTMPVIAKLALSAVIGPLLGSWISALGEEIGWRGFLVPQMAKLTSFTKTSLITGVIWAVWHYPLVIFSNYRSVAGSASGGEIPLWYALACFTITVIGLNFIFNWVRLKSGSIWTAMFLHASQNFYLQDLFTSLTVNTGTTSWVAGEFGIGLTIVVAIVALILWSKRDELPQAQAKAATS
jgi:membrane protease YdiL (CAAX protease family)